MTSEPIGPLEAETTRYLMAPHRSNPNAPKWAAQEEKLTALIVRLAREIDLLRVPVDSLEARGQD